VTKLPENICERAGDCPHETRLALIESKIKTLEDGQDREEGFRKIYYADREARIKRDAELDATLHTIEENVDKLVKRQDEEDAKPRRRWEGLKDKIIWAVLAAIIAFLLGRLGL